MNDGISNRELRIINTLLKGICTAAHSSRKRLITRAFKESVAAGYTGWALLSRGFILLIEECYDVFDETLWGKIENNSFGGKAQGQYLAYYSLRPLLFAHAHRRLAGRRMDDFERTLYRDRSEERQKIERELDRANELYEMITGQKYEERDIRIEAIAWHGKAKLAYLRLRHNKMFLSNPELPFSVSEKLDEIRRCYQNSVDLATNGHFQYAPPMNGLAWTFWLEYRERCAEYRKNATYADQNRRVELLQQCLNWSKQAMKASQATYAPPILLHAAALHQRRLETGLGTDRNKTRDLIVRAFGLSPYDCMVQDDLEDFSRLLHAEANGDPSKLAFYRTVRFAQPASATTKSLNGYLARQNNSGNADSRDQLLILRRWSSYTPLIRAREHSTVGGGYLLMWNSTKIAIDPGVGFVRNLHQYDHYVEDLDCVVMTHQHIDHAEDSEAILSILKTYAVDARARRGQKLPRFLLSRSGFERWEKMILNALDVKNGRGFIQVLSPDPTMKSRAVMDGIVIHPVPLYGHRDATDESTNGRPPTGFGLVVKLQCESGRRLKIGITSDTGYLAQAKSDGEEADRISKYYTDCDVVVLHLSTVADLEEADVLRRGEEKRKRGGKESRFIQHSCTWAASVGYGGLLYKKHLGFWGVVFFIRDLIQVGGRARTVVLSEFGEETLTSRIAILNEVCSLIGSLGTAGKEQAKRIYLGDVGTQIRFSNRRIGCNFGLNTCPKSADRFLEFDSASGDVSIPHRGWSDRGIVHLCKDHDFLIGSQYALNPSVWGYAGRVVVNDEFRKARFRDTGEVHPCIGNWWLS